jgi:hypothetical protein
MCFSKLPLAQLLGYEPTEILGKYADGWCWYNAEYNRRHTFRERELKWVVGGVGMNGRFEYGGKQGFDYKDFRDSHAWLEDAEGNVYDYVQPSWARYCKAHGVSPAGLPLGAELRAVSKEQLRNLGLHYVPADAATQKRIKKHVFSNGKMELMEGFCAALMTLK